MHGCGIDHLEPLGAVRTSPGPQFFEYRKVRRFAGNDPLPHAPVWNAKPCATLVEHALPRHAELGLETSRRIVDPRVDHLGVAGSDPAGDPLCPLDDQYRPAAPGEFRGAGETDNSAPNHH